MTTDPEATGCDGSNGAEALAVANQSPDLALLRGEVARLRAVIERLGSSEAFEGARSLDPVRDDELLARMDFARKALLSPYLMGEGFEEAPAKGAAARRSHPAALTSGRSAKDFAIEFGGYLATDATRLLDLFGQHPIVQDTMPYEAYETLCDHIQGLRSAVYEFEKRRDRALSAVPPRRPVVDEGAYTPPVPPHWSEQAPSKQHPQTAGAWDYRNDPIGGGLEASVLRLQFACDLADPRTPNQLTLVHRLDVIRLLGDWHHKSAVFEIWKRERDALSAEATDSANGVAGGAAAPLEPDADQNTSPLQPIETGGREDLSPLQSAQEPPSRPVSATADRSAPASEGGK